MSRWRIASIIVGLLGFGAAFADYHVRPYPDFSPIRSTATFMFGSGVVGVFYFKRKPIQRSLKRTAI